MVTTCSTNPGAVSLNVSPLTTIYSGNFAFATQGAVEAALMALPMVASRETAQIGTRLLQGKNATDGNGHYVQVKTFDLAAVCVRDLRDACDFVSGHVIPPLREKFFQGQDEKWVYRTAGDAVGRLFAGKSPFGDVEVGLEKRMVVGAAGVAESIPGESPVAPVRAPSEIYVMSILESVGGGRPPTDRVETSIAAFLDLFQGVQAIGVSAELDEPVGYKPSGSEGPVGVDLRRYFHALDGIVNTDMIRVGTVASALHMGVPYRDLGPVADRFGDAVLFGIFRPGVQGRELPMPITFGLRLHNLEPVPLSPVVKTWMDSGMLYLSKRNPDKRGIIELLIFPEGGISFSEGVVNILHEVAKACWKSLAEAMT